MQHFFVIVCTSKCSEASLGGEWESVHREVSYVAAKCLLDLQQWGRGLVIKTVYR